MNLDEWRREVIDLGFGKKLPEAVYIIRPRPLKAARPLFSEIRRAARAARPPMGWNLLKLHLRERSITFLSYPGFDDVPHPVLAQATKINLSTGRTIRTDYSRRANPPILHRKESFLPVDDPRFEIFRKLTIAEENAGLLENKSRIGTRLHWESLLRQKGLTFEGHELLRNDREDLKPVASEAEPVERHRTAICRSDLSRPVKFLLKHGLLRENRSFFDYGCGRGVDVEGLVQLGYSSCGWDPAYFPDSPVRPADVVNLGYVLNVIENPGERLEVLKKAAGITRQVLMVSTLVSGQQTKSHQNQSGDGYLTSSGTFQKFFEAGELEGVIEKTLELEPVTLAPGMCVVFVNREDHESFAASRVQRQIDWTEIGAQLRFARPTERRESYVSRYALHRDLYDQFWSALLLLGRIPESDEFERWKELKAVAGSKRKAVDFLLEYKGSDLFDESRKQRKEDVAVYLAMTRFRRKFRRKDIGLRIRRDIKAFWGDYDLAQQEAYSLLFASGDPGELELALDGISFGVRDDREGHFTFHRSKLGALPAVLRIYALCGQWIYGDLTDVDLIKIHLRSGKLSLMFYDDFEGKDQPILKNRVKMQLRNQWIRIFDHSEYPQPLADKRLFL